MGSVLVGVLGPTEVSVDGRAQRVSAAKKRALLSLLALRAGQRVSVESIVDALWGEAPPAGAVPTMHGYVADLRRLVEPHRAPRSRPTLLKTVPGGYSLDIAPENVDVTRFESGVKRASRDLEILGGPTVLRPRVGRGAGAAVEAAAEVLDRTLAEWRGEPLSDLGDDPETVVERDRLRGMWLDAQLLRATATLALGRLGEAVTALESCTATNPWNERAWGLRAYALALSGRQADALSCLRQLRHALRNELGIDPTVAVRELETAIIRQEVTGAVPVGGARATDRPVTSAPPRLSRGLPPGRRERWPLVGRDRELRHAEFFTEFTRSAPDPQIFLLSGGRGVGKSRIARELARLAAERGFTVGQVSARRGTRDVPLWAWRELTNSLGMSENAAEAQEQSGTAGSLLTLADRFGRNLHDSDAPVMLIVDDVHLADDASLRVLDHLLNGLDTSSLAVVLTKRTGVSPRPGREQSALANVLDTLARTHAYHRRLDNLDGDSTRELARLVAGPSLDPGDAERIWRQSGGNPFLIVELARTMRFEPDSVPPHVRTVVEEELAVLPPQTIDLLKSFGEPDQGDYVDGLRDIVRLSEAEIRGRLRPAVTAGVLRRTAEGAYAFTEEITRRVLAESNRID